MKRALISVWNKKDIVELSNFLIKNDFEIISTGGTKKKLVENGINVTSISEITGADEMMDGRVKTLHPKIFGGILADTNNSSHMDDLSRIGSKAIDLIIVNLYPFEKMSSQNIPFNQLIEYIDIGGPSMLRAAAKNYNSVITLCNPDLYSEFSSGVNIFSINKFQKMECDLYVDRIWRMNDKFYMKWKCKIIHMIE